MIEEVATRRTTLLSGLGAGILAAVLLATPWGGSAAMPGPLSTSHGQLRDDCSACHAQSVDAVQGLMHGVAPTAMDVRQSTLCVECHAFHDPTHSHNWSTTELAEAGTASRGGIPGNGLSDVQCATCHREHEDRAHDLTALGDARCQVCHTERFGSFDDHPEFSSYPQTRKTNLGFDHVSHLLKHFVEDQAESAPAACTACHALDPSGRHMPVRSYVETCAACHDEDIAGTAQTEGMGLAVLSLPALDTETLASRGVAIGHWPADSMIVETVTTPFLELLLAQDEQTARDVARVRALDLFDLTGASDAELEVVERFAWSIKELYAEVAADGHAAVLSRLEGLGNDAHSDELVGRLPEVLVQEVLALWLPGLADEVARHAAGEVLETDSEPPAGVPDPDQDLRRERWVEAGGWYFSELDFLVRYRPGAHADPFLRSWIDLTGTSGARGRRLFDALTQPDAIGRCAKCHAVLPDGDGFDVRWDGSPGGNGPRGLERFSHVEHFASAADNACLACHVLDRDSRGFQDAFLARDGAHYAPSFESITRETCGECHTGEGASSSCLTCHFYHARTEARSLPGASLDVLRARD